MSSLKLIKFETAQLLAHLYYENIEKNETSSEALLDAQIANVEIMLKNTQHLLDYLKNKRPKLTMLEIALIICACDTMSEKNDIFHFDSNTKH